MNSELETSFETRLSEIRQSLWEIEVALRYGKAPAAESAVPQPGARLEAEQLAVFAGKHDASGWAAPTAAAKLSPEG